MKSFSSRLTSGRGVACPPAFLPSRGRRPAREIATRELRSEWSISKPGQALPPPTGAAAWISSRAAPSTRQGLGVSGNFPIQLDPAASCVQFACGGGID